ncbi:MAG: hypothetical protein EAX86_10180 [Candidatus Heimdallarchaeota archaeon]|nr:hypothetical protein [Candidatus Heimdallarchaeota archaeon]
MNRLKVTAIYSIIVGTAMILMWAFFLGSESVPELSITPFEITFHILAETITALTLIVGGIGLIRKASWSRRIYYLSTGMLLYSIISEGLGYYIERGELVMICMFLILLILTLSLFGMDVYKENQVKNI